MLFGVGKNGKYYRLQSNGDYVSDDGSILDDDGPEVSSRSAICEKNPWVSTAAAVHVDQVARFNQELKDKKISGIRYRTDGKAECTSNKARNTLMKMRNMRDGDAGYGQYAGT